VVDLSSSSGGSDVMDPITGVPPSGPLGPYLGAKVLVGCTCLPMWIRVVKCGSNPRSDNGIGTGKILTRYSLSSSSLAPPCSLPLAR
jgi:hypothetical protein